MLLRLLAEEEAKGEQLGDEGEIGAHLAARCQWSPPSIVQAAREVTRSSAIFGSTLSQRLSKSKEPLPAKTNIPGEGRPPLLDCAQDRKGSAAQYRRRLLSMISKSRGSKAWREVKEPIVDLLSFTIPLTAEVARWFNPADGGERNAFNGHATNLVT